MLAMRHDLSRLVLIGVAAGFMPVGATLLATGIVAEQGQMFKGGLSILTLGAVAAVGWLIATAIDIVAAYEAGYTAGYDKGYDVARQKVRLTVVPLPRVPHRDADGF